MPAKKKKRDSRSSEKPVLRLTHEPGPDDKHIYLTIEDEPAKLTWKQYETYVFNLIRAQFPTADVTKDVRLRGMRSNIFRQIDILVKGVVAGFNITIAFDCKHYNRKLNVRHVETFLSTLEDIGVSKGVIITGQGYTKAALERARKGGRDIEVQVVDFRYLSAYHFLGRAVAWFGEVAMYVTAPSEWVIDNQPTESLNFTLFSIYPLGYTRETAMLHGPFIYGNVVTKNETLPTLEAIVEFHNRNIQASAAEHGETAKIEFLETISRKNERVLLRRAEIHEGYKGPEYTLYIERPQGVVILVLYTRGEEEQALRQDLEWVGRNLDLLDTDQLPPDFTNRTDTRPPGRIRLLLERVDSQSPSEGGDTRPSRTSS